MMSYEKEQAYLTRLLEEVDTGEESIDDEEDDHEIDNLEERIGDSETEQEGRIGDSETEQEGDSEAEECADVYFTGKDGVTKWNKHQFSQRVRTSKANLLTRLPGVKGTAREVKSILGCWKLLFTDAMLNIIVNSTNKYIEAISDSYSRKRDCKPTDLAEIKALMGLLYMAGILKGSRLSTEELWNRNGTGVELFWMTMSLQSMFGYQKNKTIVSYVPRKGKNVVLMSSMHFDDSIDASTMEQSKPYVPRKGKNVVLMSSMHFDDSIDASTMEQSKPDIVTFYNSTKSGVDVVDKLGATYNCARNTRRWPMVILYALMNVAGINSQIIYTANNPKTTILRRHYLKSLARELIDEHLKFRSTLRNLPPEVKRRRQEFSGTFQEPPQQPAEARELIDEHLKFRSTLRNLPPEVKRRRQEFSGTFQEPPQQPAEGIRKRCENCKGKDNKTRYYCQSCFKLQRKGQQNTILLPELL
ncbi:Transposase IS4 [Popillia japonica]|uniref:Transposase IS4 n=1 Tax=Popillia japonica TaxID=7064 RepID=A0AAW1LI58_POPJA